MLVSCFHYLSLDHHYFVWKPAIMDWLVGLLTFPSLPLEYLLEFW
jgi:hypothetical protein